LTDISGARDDLSPHRFLRDRAASGLRRPTPEVALNAITLGLPALGDQPIWRGVVQHLFEAGIEDIYVFSLETGITGLQVIRVLASGLNAVRGGVQQMTPRMLERLMAGWLST
jgi:ribosomal protein S12 methylthiotransferase accessory factor